MKNTIWKYALPLDNLVTLEMPQNAQLLHVGLQGRELMLWAVVRPNLIKVKRSIAVVGTGHPMPDTWEKHIGTVAQTSSWGELVWHVFDLGEEYA